MSAFFVRHRRLTAVLAGLIVCVISFEAWSRWLTVDPLNMPFALSPAGRIDQDVQIRRDCPHSLELLFSIGTRPRKEAETLIGAFGATGGVKVPMKWSLVDPTGRVISSGEKETAGSQAWGAIGFFRTVVTGLRLPHGRYRLNADLLHDVPEMDGLSARLLLGCHNGKLFSGWQDNLLFFGQIAEWLVVLPLTALLAAILIALETRSWLGRRKRDR